MVFLYVKERDRDTLSWYVRVTSVLYHILYSGHTGRDPLLPFQELLHFHDKMCLWNSKHVQFINFLRSFTFKQQTSWTCQECQVKEITKCVEKYIHHSLDSIHMFLSQIVLKHYLAQ